MPGDGQQHNSPPPHKKNLRLSASQYTKKGQQILKGDTRE